ncbi:MAG: cation:proton antiporter, partial [Kiritimatiellae bacterium]|nr:cation:proton antiporter [Kiritimatiellia bacterium]
MIMVLVAVVSSVFTRLGWPKVIGYILAGTLAGKYTLGGSFIVNERSIDVLGQLGVIFLMFSLGMAFNIGKLRKVSRVAAPTALLDMVVMVWAGHFIGVRVLGWGSVQSLFLGAAISDSATTLLAKTINDMGWGMRRFTKYIFGITIMEDIFCIGLIAILTG